MVCLPCIWRARCVPFPCRPGSQAPELTTRRSPVGSEGVELAWHPRHRRPFQAAATATYSGGVRRPRWRRRRRRYPGLAVEEPPRPRNLASLARWITIGLLIVVGVGLLAAGVRWGTALAALGGSRFVAAAWLDVRPAGGHVHTDYPYACAVGATELVHVTPPSPD